MTEKEKQILLAEIQKLTPAAQDILNNLLDAEKNLPRVEVIDEKHRRFNGEIYTKHEATGYYVFRKTLHVEVYKFYNNLAEIPKDCLVHHAGKDDNGNFDKEKNDIEFLEMMTPKDHTALHCQLELNRMKTFICKNCGKEFSTWKYGRKQFCSSHCAKLSQQSKMKSKQNSN